MTPVWRAIAAAWRAGSALGGSSAGAMALCQWCRVQRTAAVHRDGRWEVFGPGSVTILRGSLRDRHVEGELIEGLSNPEP